MVWSRLLMGCAGKSKLSFGGKVMPPQFNPITAPLTAIKQMGEQANVAIQSFGTGMATVASQGLDGLMAAVPPLPGVPGAARAPALPTMILPGNLVQALSQVENMVIPPGLPRPSAVLGARPTPTPQPPPTVPTVPPAVAARRRVAERRGI